MPARPRRTEPAMPANPSVISAHCSRTEARPSAALDEAELVARLAAGDREEALAALYDLYGRRLYALGVHLLHDTGSRRTSCRRRSCGCGAPRTGTTPALVGADVRLHARETRRRRSLAEELERAGDYGRRARHGGRRRRSRVRRGGAAARRRRGAGRLDARAPRGARAPVPRRPDADPGRGAARHPARHGQDAHAVRAALALRGVEGARSD